MLGKEDHWLSTVVYDLKKTYLPPNLLPEILYSRALSETLANEMGLFLILPSYLTHASLVLSEELCRSRSNLASIAAYGGREIKNGHFEVRSVCYYKLG